MALSDSGRYRRPIPITWDKKLPRIGVNVHASGAGHYRCDDPRPRFSTRFAHSTNGGAMSNILDLQNLPTDVSRCEDGGEWGTTASLDTCTRYRMDGFAG